MATLKATIHEDLLIDSIDASSAIIILEILLCIGHVFLGFSSQSKLVEIGLENLSGL